MDILLQHFYAFENWKQKLKTEIKNNFERF